MRKNLLILFYLCLTLLSCNKEEELVIPEPEIIQPLDTPIEFGFRQIDNPDNLTEDVVGRLTADQITGVAPFLLKSDSLVATFSVPSGTIVTVANKTQISGVSKNDFSKPVVYTFKTPQGTAKQLSVNLTTFTQLPILYLNTADTLPVSSKDEYKSASLKVKGNGQYQEGLYNGGIQIKGRGNSTWYSMPKKPYKIKLNQKAPLLNMPADREWVLLANYSDKTLMRNYVSFELSRRLGLKYTPRARFVEVFLNGNYEGNYLLTEEIKISKDRVDIEELDRSDNSPEEITGGYLLEIDVRQDAASWFKTNKDIIFCLKSPESPSPDQYNYIKAYVQKTEEILYSDNFTDTKEGYAKYINVDSFVNWYLLNEITKNSDAVFYTSVYLFKDRNNKLCIGPAWDFDIAAGNINFLDIEKPEGFYIMNSLWIERLFQDPAFAEKVKTRFNQLKQTQLNTLPQFINQTAAYLNKSQEANFNRWDILNIYVWPNAVALGSHEKEVAYLNNWLQKRIAWMEKEFTIN
ncbi:hypothetical protein AAE02nite_45390 [Adhaeribacter aerolatus]|uniref:Spore coat protein CotH n=1 Tax=Adhaeribacter aerolatus TaxID=670289 RepID=A0A512B4H0_9BACT|nr:CotH kinase family protein [Adhaeribacter aerolatus]GEO06875.1 hypothetical protein AAE02nite_45390 [Adhaeribacter aerolatus]